MDTTKIKNYLNNVLEDRIQKNPRYSLRAFAKNLEENPATLSQILSGKRSITDKRLKKFAARLDLTPEELLQECGEGTDNYKVLTVDFFKVISDWYYDAILELTKVANFSSSTRWISKTLGLDYNQTKVAIERLKTLDLLDTSIKNDWIDNSEKNLVSFDSDYSSVALRKYQKQILEKSHESIDLHQRGVREHNSFIIGCDKNLSGEIHKKIQAFQLELAEYIETNSIEINEVRALHFGSFPITQDNN